MEQPEPAGLLCTRGVCKAKGVQGWWEKRSLQSTRMLDLNDHELSEYSTSTIIFLSRCASAWSLGCHGGMQTQAPLTTSRVTTPCLRMRRRRCLAACESWSNVRPAIFVTVQHQHSINTLYHVQTRSAQCSFGSESGGGDCKSKA